VSWPEEAPKAIISNLAFLWQPNNLHGKIDFFDETLKGSLYLGLEALFPLI